MVPINSLKNLGFDYALCAMARTHFKIIAPVSSFHCSQSYRPHLSPKFKAVTFSSSSFTAHDSRVRVFDLRYEGPEQRFKVQRISCLLDDSCQGYQDAENSQQEAAILKLPRRSLLVAFTCDACGARSQRLINRLAYERGLVYVQCAGCSQYHKLVDNLGLVIEHNLQEEFDLDASEVKSSDGF